MPSKKKIIWPEFPHGSLDAEDSAGEYCKKLAELKLAADMQAKAGSGAKEAETFKGGKPFSPSKPSKTTAPSQIEEMVKATKVQGLHFSDGKFSEDASTLLAKLLFEERGADLVRNQSYHKDSVRPLQALHADHLHITKMLQDCTTEEDITGLWQKKDNDEELSPQQQIILKLLQLTQPTPKKAYPVAFYKQHLLTELCLIEQQISTVLGCLVVNGFHTIKATFTDAYTRQDTLFFEGLASHTKRQAVKAKKTLVDLQTEANEALQKTLKYPAKVCDAQIAGLTTIEVTKKGSREKERHGNVILAHQNPSVRPFEPEDPDILRLWNGFLDEYKKDTIANPTGAPLILSEGQWAALTEICAAVKMNKARPEAASKLAAKVDIWMRQGGGKSFVVKQILRGLFPDAKVLEYTIHSTDTEIKNLITAHARGLGSKKVIVCLDESYFYDRFSNVFLEVHGEVLKLKDKTVANLTPEEKEKLRVYSIRNLRTMKGEVTIVNFGASQSPSLLKVKEIRGKLKESDLKRKLAEADLKMNEQDQDPKAVALHSLEEALSDLQSLETRLNKVTRPNYTVISQALTPDRPTSAGKRSRPLEGMITESNSQEVYDLLLQIADARVTKAGGTATHQLNRLKALLNASAQGNQISQEITDQEVAALIVHMKNEEVKRIRTIINQATETLSIKAEAIEVAATPSTPRKKPQESLVSEVTILKNSLQNQLVKIKESSPIDTSAAQAAAAMTKKLEDTRTIASIRARQFSEFEKRAENNKRMYEDEKTQFHPITENNQTLSARVTAGLATLSTAVTRTLPVAPLKRTGSGKSAALTSVAVADKKEAAQRIQYIVPDLHLTETEVTKIALRAISEAKKLDYVAAPITFADETHGGAIFQKNTFSTRDGLLTKYKTTDEFRRALNDIAEKDDKTLLVIFDDTTYIGGDYDRASRRITNHVFDANNESLANLAMESFMQAKRSRDPLSHQMNSINYNVVVHGAGKDLTKESFFQKLEENAKLRDAEALSTLVNAKKTRHGQVAKLLDQAILFILNQENQGRWDECKDRDAMIWQDLNGVGKEEGAKDKSKSAFEGCNAYLAIEEKVINGELNLKNKIVDAVLLKVQELGREDSQEGQYTRAILNTKDTAELLTLFQTISKKVVAEGEIRLGDRQKNLAAEEREQAAIAAKEENERALAAAKLSLKEAKGELQKSAALLPTIAQLIQAGEALNDELTTANIDPINEELKACVQSKVALEGALSEEGESIKKRIEALVTALEADSLLVDAEPEAVNNAAGDIIEEAAVDVAKTDHKTYITTSQRLLNKIAEELDAINAEATTAIAALTQAIELRQAAINKKTAADALAEQEQETRRLAIQQQQQEEEARKEAAAAQELTFAQERLGTNKEALQTQYNAVGVKNKALADLAAQLGENPITELGEEDGEEEEEGIDGELVVLQEEIDALIGEYDAAKVEIDEKLAVINTFLTTANPDDIEAIKEAIAKIAEHTANLGEISEQIDGLSEEIAEKAKEAFEKKKTGLETLLQFAEGHLAECDKLKDQLPAEFMVQIPTKDGEEATVTFQARHDELQAAIAAIRTQIQTINQSAVDNITTYAKGLELLIKEETNSVTTNTDELLRNTSALQEWVIAAITKKTAADALALTQQQQEKEARAAEAAAAAQELTIAQERLGTNKEALQAQYNAVDGKNKALAALAGAFKAANPALEEETADDADGEAEAVAPQTAIQELIAKYDAEKTAIDAKLGAINTFLQDTPVGIDLIKAAIADIAKHTATLEEITAQIDDLSEKITGLIDERDQAAALLAQQQEEKDLVKNTQAFEARKLELTKLLQLATEKLAQSIAKTREVPENFMVTIEGEPAQKVTLQARHGELQAVIAKITAQIEQITQEINLEKTPLAYQGALAKLTREDEEGSVTNSTTQLLQNTNDLLQQVTAAAEAKLAAAQDAALRLQQDTATALQGLVTQKEALRANHTAVAAKNLELSHLINNQKANLDLSADDLAEDDGEKTPQQQLAEALTKYEAEKVKIAEDLAAIATFLTAENPAAIKEIQANIKTIETHTATLKKISDQVIDLNGKIIASIERKAAAIAAQAEEEKAKAAKIEAERVAAQQREAEKLAQEQAALLKQQQEEALKAERIKLAAEAEERERAKKAKANPPTLTESLTLAAAMITPNKAPTEWDKEYGTDEAARQKTLADYAVRDHPKAIGADAEKIGAENATLKAYGNACIKIKESKAPTPPFDDIISNLYTPEKMALIAMHITRSNTANATREKFEEFDFKNNKPLFDQMLIAALTDLTTGTKLDESIAWVADPEKIFRERDKKDLEEKYKDINYSADEKSKPKTFAMKTKAGALAKKELSK